MPLDYAGAMIGAVTMVTLMAAPQWSRDQARLELLSRWGDQLVAISDRVFTLDLEKASAMPLDVPGLEKVQFVAGDSVRFAAGLRGGKPVLRRETGEGWVDVALPKALQGAKGKPLLRLGAAGERVALLWVTIQETKPPGVERGLAFFDGAKWLELAIAPGAQGLPKHLRFLQGRWFVGYSRGEWGGSLWVLDESAGALRELPGDRLLPIVGLAAGGNGEVIVGAGLAHLSLSMGTVRALLPDATWSALASSNKPPTWPSEDSLEGLDVDETGGVVMVSGSRGLLRLEADLSSLGFPWPKDHVYADGLLVMKDAYLVGTFDSGVLIGRRSAKTWKRIPLPR